MTMECLELQSGRRLERHRSRWVMMPGEKAVGVVIEGSVAVVTDPDTGRELRDPIVDSLDAMFPPKKRVRTQRVTGGDPAGTSAAVGRWQTLNQFVDLVGPRLSLADRWVWMKMFRLAMHGVCETSVRQLAAGGISRSTAEGAIRSLCELGLIWPVRLSRDKSKASKYGLHPNPAVCLDRLLKGSEPSRSAGRIDGEPSRPPGRSAR